MKMRKDISVFIFAVAIFAFSSLVVSACNLGVTLVSQDPYPVTPGENVKMVFQVTGGDSSDCGMVAFQIEDSFPFKVDPSMPNIRTVQSGGYLKDYKTFWLLPYILRIDSDAKEGDNQLDVLVSNNIGEGRVLKSFNVSVKDVRTDFGVSVKNYDPITKKITFEILNKGKNNVEALSVELRGGENVALRGTSTNIIGSLDSNDFTTADFEASAEKGPINLIMHYTDITETRRDISETINFDPEPFILKSKASQGSSMGTYIFLLVIVVLVVVLVIVVISGVGYYLWQRNKEDY